MKKNRKNNVDGVLIDELQKAVLNSPSLKKYHQESEKIIKNLQIPQHFVSK